MRNGGINKFCEIIIITASCGLDIVIKMLGYYYDSHEISAVAGALTALLVFTYIVIMKIVSIFENYSEINLDSQWKLKINKHLKIILKTRNVNYL